MMAIVCGDIIEAPRPLHHAGDHQAPIVPVRPHHRDDRVKTTRPARYIRLGPTSIAEPTRDDEHRHGIRQEIGGGDPHDGVHVRSEVR